MRKLIVGLISCFTLICGISFADNAIQQWDINAGITDDGLIEVSNTISVSNTQNNGSLDIIIPHDDTMIKYQYTGFFANGRSYQIKQASNPTIISISTPTNIGGNYIYPLEYHVTPGYKEVQGHKVVYFPIIGKQYTAINNATFLFRIPSDLRMDQIAQTIVRKMSNPGAAEDIPYETKPGGVAGKVSLQAGEYVIIMMKIDNRTPKTTQKATSSSQNIEQETSNIQSDTTKVQTIVPINTSDFHNQNSQYDFIIDDYDVDTQIQSDGSLAITETINVYFNQSKHGIERLLPQRYTYDSTHDELVNYTNINTNITKSTYTEGPNLVLRLGDADRLVNGSQQYVISYTASPGVKQYSGWQELYWNLVGTQWGVPIRQVTFRVATPAGVDLTKLGSGDIQVVAGNYGATGNIKTMITQGGIVGQATNLGINEGVTVGIKFNNHTFSSLAPRQYQSHLIQNQKNNTEHQSTNLLVRLFVVLGVGIWLFFGWLSFMPIRQENHKKQQAGTIVTQHYPPPGITPAVAGYINNNAFDTVDFMATLYDWGARGYISIAEEIKSGIFNNKTHIIYYKRINPIDLVPYEQIIWNMMFDGAGSFDFDNLDRGWFSDHGKTFFEGIINTITNESQKFYESAKGIVGWMGNKNLTTEGSKIYAHLLGYREFIQTVEQSKLEEFIKQDPLFVDKLLPWAVIFGLETRLVQKLEGLERNKPARYVGDGFTINTFDYIMNVSTRPLIPSSDSGVLKGLGAGFDIALGTISIVTGGGGGGGGGRSR